MLTRLRKGFHRLNNHQKMLAVAAFIFGVFLIFALLFSPQQPEPAFQPTEIRTSMAGPAVTLTPTLAPLFLPSQTPIPTRPGNQPTEPVAEITATVSAAPSSAVNEFFVAVDGEQSGDGSKEEPWPLQYALNHPGRVKPGDTIWVLGGEYRGSFSSHLKGEPEKPITVRAVPGERVIWISDDRVLDISTTRYVNFWGIEITASENSRDPLERPETAYGVRMNQGKESHNIKFINMIVHDMPAQGFAWWQANYDSEIYGSLIYFNGVNQFDHGIYMMNEKGYKKLTDTFIFDNASHGVHAYNGARSQWLNNLHIEGNTVFNNGSIGYTTTSGRYGLFKRNLLVGGVNVAENPVIINNYTYFPGGLGEALNLGFRAGSSNARVENNYFAGGRIQLAGKNPGVILEGNTILTLGAAPRGVLPNSQNQWYLFRPAETRIFVRPNQYEPGRANITIYNWQKRDEVMLTAQDLSGVDFEPGDTYQLRNVQDYFDDVITGTYDGSAITVPMTGHTVAQPLGLGFKPSSTFPEFGAFVLIVQGK